MASDTTEATVATGAAAFDAARTQIAKGDDTSSQPAQEPDKVADESTATTDTKPDVLEIPEEDVKKLSLRDQQVYRALQKKFTETSQKHSALEKQLQPWKPLIDAFTENPEQALAQLAEERGFRLAKINQDTQTVERQTAAALSELPPDLDFLKPYFDAYGKQIIETVRREIAPIKETTEHIISEAAAAETQGTLDAFTAKYPEWQKHETQMLELGQKFIPAKGKMTDFEYMEHLYSLATADMRKAEQTKAVISQINKSVGAAETATPGMSSRNVEHTLPPEGKRGIREAFEAAKRGERWVR